MSVHIRPNGKTAVITAPYSGIGSELTKLLAKDGFDLVLLNRDAVKTQAQMREPNRTTMSASAGVPLFFKMLVPFFSIQTIKSITAREIFARHPEVKKKLWGWQFWSDGYFVNTVSKFGSKATIRNYEKNQGVEEEYEKLHEKADGEQLTFF